MGDTNGPSCLMMLVLAYMAVTIGLQSAILAKGLNGDFASVDGGPSEITTPEPTNPPDGVQIGGYPPATVGSCATLSRMQRAGERPAGVPGWHPDNNIMVSLPNANSCPVSVSETWTVAGWHTTFVQLAPGATFYPPIVTDEEQTMLKVLRGTVLDVNVNGILRPDGRWETYVVSPPNRPISLWIGHDIKEIEAGSNGAVIIYFKVPKSILKTPLESMNTAPATSISGPFSENLQWVQFGNYYPDPFAGVEFYNLAGIYLQDPSGARLAYFQWWTFREDFDADRYHNHADLDAANTFAEIHMALYAPSAISGMQSMMPFTENLNTIPNPNPVLADEFHKYDRNDASEAQLSVPMPPGFAHGPLWSVDPTTRRPTTNCFGGVQYPFHRWMSGAGNGGLGFNNPLRYAMWIAFEHPPQYAEIPATMMAHWTNAYLQSTMDPYDCGNVTRTRD